MKMTIDECMKHIPDVVTPEIWAFAIESTFDHRRYIFTTRRGKQQFGYCTYCKSDFYTGGLRHGDHTFCPECNSECIVKASGIGRKALIDEAYLVYYMKSAIDPQVIVAVGNYAVRDFSGDYRQVETRFINQALYVFRPGIGGDAFIRGTYYNRDAKTLHAYYSYTHAKSVKCQFDRNHNAYINVDYCRESIGAAVADTPFQYSTWEQYRTGDMTEFFDLYAKYPCVEYLTKAGMKNIVERKLCGDYTYGAINWRAKSLPKVLKVTKPELRALKKSDFITDLLFLRLLQMSKKDGSNLTWEEIQELKSLRFEDIQKACKHMSLRQLRKYINKLYEYYKAKEDSQHYCGARIPISHTMQDILRTIRDYIADCIELEMNLQDERILFPKDIYKAHQEASKRIKSEANKRMDERIRRRLPSLSKYCFRYKGLMIRPAESTKELIAEGKALTICVGNYSNGYMDSYAKGKTILLLIRKTSEPDKPYYTMELKGNTVIQCQGKEHCSPNKEVQEFIEAFKAEKVEQKSKKMGVAV